MLKATHKYETWIAEIGTSVFFIPVNIAKRNGMKLRPIDADEPAYLGVIGTELTILGHLDKRTFGYRKDIIFSSCKLFDEFLIC